MNGKYDSVVIKHPRPQPVQRRNHADPGIAVDERRNGKRRNEQRTPERPAGQVGPLHQPGRPDTDDHTQRHRDDDQRDGVEQQFADPRPDDQVVGARPPDGHRAPHHVAERDAGGGDQNRDRGRDQWARPGGRAQAAKPAPRGAEPGERPPITSPPSSSGPPPSARPASTGPPWAPAASPAAAERDSPVHRWPPGTRTRCPSPALPGRPCR